MGARRTTSQASFRHASAPGWNQSDHCAGRSAARGSRSTRRRSFTLLETAFRDNGHLKPALRAAEADEILEVQRPAGKRAGSFTPRTRVRRRTRRGACASWSRSPAPPARVSTGRLRRGCRGRSELRLFAEAGEECDGEVDHDFGSRKLQEARR
jgi:hypothetical protein